MTARPQHRRRAAPRACLFLVVAATLPSATRADEPPVPPDDAATDEAMDDSETSSSETSSSELSNTETSSSRPSSGEPSNTEPTLRSVYFIGLDRLDIDEERATLVDDLVLAALLERADCRVASDRDIESALARAATAQEQACFTESESCVREVALAFGSSFALAGTVSLVDAMVVVALVLIDTRTGLPVAREELEAASVDALKERLSAALHNLFAPLTDAARIEVAKEPPPRRFHDAEVLTIAIASGALAGVALAAVGAAPLLLFAALVEDPQFPVGWMPPVFVAWALAPIVGGALTGAGAALADLLAGAEVGRLRVVVATVAGATLLLVAVPVVVGSAFGAFNMASGVIYATRPEPIDFETYYASGEYLAPSLSAGIAFAAAAAVVMGVSTTGTALATFALTEDAPTFGEE